MNPTIKIPQLATQFSSPLHQLEDIIFQNSEKIEVWIENQFKKTRAPFYSSVDIRNAGFKLSPVDTNLFPAGFNNLKLDCVEIAVKAVKNFLKRVCPEAKAVLLIPESHSRNIFYFENLAALVDILKKSGLEVKIGSLDPEITQAKMIQLKNAQISLQPVLRKANRLYIEDFSPCVILLNNDLSAGMPEILQGLEQKIVPATHLGWYRRLKSSHFQLYQDIVREFSEVIQVDPWLLAPLFRYCGEVDFMQRAGLECLVSHTETLLKSIQLKYQENKIDLKPFVAIKADAGTYGMAVMMINDVAELSHLNRKQRTHMSAIKGGGKVTKVIVQEGVYSFETYDDAVAEPVVYLINGEVIGGFYRIHQARGSDENLNAPGMQFAPFPFHCDCHTIKENKSIEARRYYVYGVIARLATLAAARELAQGE